jgi:hypothetical protein
MQLVQGTLAATGNSPAFQLQTPQSGLAGTVDIEIYGIFTGFSVQLQRLAADLVTWLNIGAAITVAGFNNVAIGCEAGRTYQLAITGTGPTGNCIYRVGQS